MGGTFQDHPQDERHPHRLPDHHQAGGGYHFLRRVHHGDVRNRADHSAGRREHLRRRRPRRIGGKDGQHLHMDHPLFPHHDPAGAHPDPFPGSCPVATETFGLIPRIIIEGLTGR